MGLELIIPGGTTGPPGPQGSQGPPGLDGQEGVEGLDGTPGPSGTGTDPLQGFYAPGSFDVPTGKYALMSRHLILTGTQRVTLHGTGTLRIT